MKRILILAGRYLPGFKDGGPVRTILNLTEWFGDEYDIRVMCLDRDHGDEQPYPDIKVDEFNKVGKAQVWYTQHFTAEAIERLAKEAAVEYCCGPYNDYARIAMKLKREGKIKAPLYVAAMGSFSPAAFKIKGFKKKLFVDYMKLSGNFNKVIWSVTSKREEKELREIIGKGAKCIVAEDLARQKVQEHLHIKEVNKLKLIFLSRISRKKNLVVVPDILKELSDAYEIEIDVYGVCEDEEYLKECMDKFKKLPARIKWEYKGELDSEAVPKVFADYDVFLFPTLGENYGHVIAEALSAGCVPVISDTTPWLDFDKKGCGAVCSLDALQDFTAALEKLAALNSDEFGECIKKCYEYYEKKNEDAVKNSGYRMIFS